MGHQTLQTLGWKPCFERQLSPGEGDWVLLTQAANRGIRRLERESVIAGKRQRRGELD